MANETLRTAIEALRLVVQGVDGIKEATINPRISSSLSPSQLPLVVIHEGAFENDYSVTNETGITYDIAMRMLYKPSKDQFEEFGSEMNARDLGESIIGAIDVDPSLGGTCLLCELIRGDPPVSWPTDSSVNFRDYLVQLTVRRDRL